MVAGDYLARNLKCLAVEGRLVIIAVQHGPKVEQLNVLPIMLRRLTVTGSTLRPRSVEQKAAIAHALHAEVWPLLAAGTVRPIVHSRFPLSDAGRRPSADGEQRARRKESCWRSEPQISPLRRLAACSPSASRLWRTGERQHPASNQLRLPRRGRAGGEAAGVRGRGET